MRHHTKHMVIVAGPNGAGKSTTAPAILKETLQIHHYVNADTLAAGLCAFEPEKASLEAGRIMLSQLRHLAATGEHFAFETTLASRHFAKWLPSLKTMGYERHLIFLWLKDANLAKDRVAQRVARGGHAIPAATITRRYHAGIRNFFKLYRHQLEHWTFYDNSKTESIIKIASFHLGKLEIFNHDTWHTLLEQYNAAQT